MTAKHTPGVHRYFMRHSPEARANMASSHRLGHRQREAFGEYYWTADATPGTAYGSASAARRAQEAAEAAEGRS